jgi:predicted secreted protein
VELRVGEKTAIRLPGRAMSGYRWTAHVSGDAVTVSVSPAPREEIDGRPPGAGADEIATVEALRPGRATVTLELRRSWENTPQPQDRRTFEVTVA